MPKRSHSLLETMTDKMRALIEEHYNSSRLVSGQSNSVTKSTSQELIPQLSIMQPGPAASVLSFASSVTSFLNSSHKCF